MIGGQNAVFRHVSRNAGNQDQREEPESAQILFQGPAQYGKDHGVEADVGESEMQKRRSYQPPVFPVMKFCRIQRQGVKHRPAGGSVHK